MRRYCPSPIYVNGEIRNSTPLGKLMSDFFCKEADGMNYKVLADRVMYFKETEGCKGNMCKAMEEMRAESREEGISIGKAEAIAESIKKLVAKGFTEAKARELPA